MIELENSNSLIEIFNNTLKECSNTENNQILEKMINKINLIQTLLNNQIKKQLNDDSIDEYKIIL